MSLRLAVVGCAHGALDAVYGAVAEASRDRPVDLVICTGDFQATRNEDDLECMSVPDKYKDMCSFWRYYNNSPPNHPPTIFIGGNHEASNHLQELPLGGLVAPGMYYLGSAGVVNFRGLRIAGISGVYTAHNYKRPRYEAPPYTGSALRSVYHTRLEDAAALARLSRPVDVFLSHDWPTGITAYGDQDALLRSKPFLRSEIANGSFGSPASAGLLKLLRPRYWFAAHVHVKFAALVPHPGSASKPTKFLALDKALPRRDFVQILDVSPQAGKSAFEPPPAPGSPIAFGLDPEWLAILKSGGGSSGHDPASDDAPPPVPVSDEEMEAAVDALSNTGLSMAVLSPTDFELTARVYDPARRRRGTRPSGIVVQHRNVALARALGINLQPESRSAVPVGVPLIANEAHDDAGSSPNHVDETIGIAKRQKLESEAAVNGTGS